MREEGEREATGERGGREEKGLATARERRD